MFVWSVHHLEKMTLKSDLKKHLSRFMGFFLIIKSIVRLNWSLLMHLFFMYLFRLFFFVDNKRQHENKIHHKDTNSKPRTMSWVPGPLESIIGERENGKECQNGTLLQGRVEGSYPTGVTQRDSHKHHLQFSSKPHGS